MKRIADAVRRIGARLMVVAADRTGLRTWPAAGLVLLICFAGSMTARAADAMLRGQVRIDSAVAGDLKLNAERVEIAAPVTGDLDARGLTIAILPGGSISGRSRIVADTVRIAGRMTGGEIEAKSVELTGAVDGALKIATDTLAIGPGARISAPITYAANQDAKIDSGADLRASISRLDTGGNAIETSDRSWLVPILGLAAALLAWTMPDIIGRGRSAFEAGIGRAMVDGMIALVVPPAVITVFALSLFGLPFAVVFGLFYGALLAGAGIAAIITMGEWLFLSFGRPLSGPLKNRLSAIACGTVFLWVMTTALGPAAWAAACALGLGVIGALCERVLAPQAAL